MSVCPYHGSHWDTPLTIGAPSVNEAAVPQVVTGATGQVVITIAWPLTLNRGFVLIHAPLAVAADFVRITAHPVTNDARTAAFAVVTDRIRAATALPVTANNPFGATHSAAVG
jgi:hypothetical protein